MNHKQFVPHFFLRFGVAIVLYVIVTIAGAALIKIGVPDRIVFSSCLVTIFLLVVSIRNATRSTLHALGRYAFLIRHTLLFLGFVSIGFSFFVLPRDPTDLQDMMIVLWVIFLLTLLAAVIEVLDRSVHAFLEEEEEKEEEGQEARAASKNS